MIPANLDGPMAIRLITTIHDIMNGEQWSSDTTQAIADTLVEHGFSFDDDEVYTYQARVTLQPGHAVAKFHEVEAENDSEALRIAVETYGDCLTDLTLENEVEYDRVIWTLDDYETVEEAVAAIPGIIADPAVQGRTAATRT